jgi:hypothetical protein
MSALAPRSAERCTAIRECLKTQRRAYRPKIKKILASHKILKPRTALKTRTVRANPGHMVSPTVDINLQLIEQHVKESALPSVLEVSKSGYMY